MLQRKKIWQRVETRSASHYDHDSLIDMIADLQELSERYPGARINTYHEYDSEYMAIEIERDETDVELKRRETEEAARVVQRRKNYEALKKEFGDK
jgi:hypothetical protein